MNKNDKLKLVFDFIADYLTEDEKTTLNVNTSKSSITNVEDANLTHSVKLMKKMDEIDKINTAVKSSTRPLIDKITKIKKEYTENVLNDKFLERTGVTLDENGQVVTVQVGPLTKDKSIKDILKEQEVIKD